MDTEEEITNPYELQRQQIIARNRARLLALDIPQAVANLTKLAPAKKPRQPRPKRPDADAAEEPSRQSNRLRDRDMIARGEVPPDVKPGSELALFIIDGECPRCGKVLSVGHARHLDVCKGPPEPPTEEEIAAKAEAYRSQQKDKLRELELGGLVDFRPDSNTTAAAAGGGGAGAGGGAAAAGGGGDDDTADKDTAAAAAAADLSEPQQQEQPEVQQKRGGKGKTAKGKAKGKAAAAADDGSGAQATFIVIGSKGSHYAVKISDAKRSCECMDYRFRRRDCKHIKLILEQLGVARKPSGWQQALCQQLDDLCAADESDVQRVKEAEERAQARKDKAAAKEAASAAGEQEQEEAPPATAAGDGGGGKKPRKAAAGRKRKAS